MGVLQSSGTRWIVFAVCLGISGTAHAACTVPASLKAKLHAKPTVQDAITVGNWFASHQQFGCAVETFRAALQSAPKSAQLHYLEGLALSGWGHTTEAIGALQESIRLEPGVLKPHLILASLLQQSQRPAEAFEQWREALEIDPHNILALEGFSDGLVAQQDWVSVIGLLRSAPRTEHLALNLSRAYGKLNYLDAANDVLTEALRLSPLSMPLVSAESVVLVKQHRYQDTVKLLEQAVKQHPGNEEAEIEFFRILSLTNDLDRARPLGLKLLAKSPHNPEILYLNGVVDRAMGDYAQSKAHLEEAVALDPNYFNSRYNLGIVLVFLKEWKEAKEQLEQAIALGAIEPQVHFELAKALRGLGDTQGALEESQKYMQLKKAQESRLEAASISAQGDKDMDAGNLKDAIAHFRDAADKEPTNAVYKYKLSIALHQSGDLAGELAQLQAAVKLDPNLAGAQKQLGYLLFTSGDAAGAVEHFKMTVQAAPAWVDAWINLSAALASESHLTEAREAVAMALRLDPDNSQARELSDELTRNADGQQAHQ